MANSTQIILLAIYALLAAAFISYLLTAIVFNMRVGLMYRERLAANIDLLRLGGMLKALGIDTAEYLHSQSTVEIQRQMAKCAGCGETDSCDRDVEAGAISVDGMSYCPNDAALQALRREGATDSQ